MQLYSGFLQKIYRLNHRQITQITIMALEIEASTIEILNSRRSGSLILWYSISFLSLAFRRVNRTAV